MTVTPATLSELAARAETLTAEIRRLCDGVPLGSPEVEPFLTARLAADRMAKGAEELQQAADELARLRTVPTCGMPWAVCPEHGNTLSSQAGISECRVCHRTWNYDRPGRPCGEPVKWKVIDRAGTETQMCDGHVLGARAATHGATFVRLDLPY